MSLPSVVIYATPISPEPESLNIHGEDVTVPIKVKGKPTNERGGKSKFLYQITEEGKQALMEIRKANEQVWSGALDLI